MLEKLLRLESIKKYPHDTELLEDLFFFNDTATTEIYTLSLHDALPISPLAWLTGAWAVNDPSATNVAQIVISGTRRHTPPDAVSMPAFGNAYSDVEIAAVANYVTARFGSKPSRITAQEVAELRKQTSQ